MKAQFVIHHQTILPIDRLCPLAGISKSGLYQWLSRPKSERSVDDEKLISKIRFFFARSRKSYGCRRIADDLREDNIDCSKNRVNRLMRQAGLKYRLHL